MSILQANTIVDGSIISCIIAATAIGICHVLYTLSHAIAYPVIM